MNKMISAFDCDPNFCSNCGAILALPDESDIIKCRLCGTIVNIENLEGVIIHYSKDYNQDKLKTAEELARLKSAITETDKSGPIVKRDCAKCGHKKMTYTTRQTRSADEGQTVFYTCLKCRFTEQEYS